MCPSRAFRLLTARHSLSPRVVLYKTIHQSTTDGEYLSLWVFAVFSTLLLAAASPSLFWPRQTTGFQILWQCRLASSSARLLNLAACTMHSSSSPRGSWCRGNFLTCNDLYKLVATVTHPCIEF